LEKVKFWDLVEECPIAAFELEMYRAEQTLWKYKSMWTSSLGIDGACYGSYKKMYRKDFIGRSFIVYEGDGAMSIFFTDELFDPKTNTSVPNVDNKRRTEPCFDYSKQIKNYGRL